MSHVCSCVHTRAQQHALSVCPRCTGTHSPTFPQNSLGASWASGPTLAPPHTALVTCPRNCARHECVRASPLCLLAGPHGLRGGLLAWSSAGGSGQWGPVHSWRRSWNPDITFSMLGGAGLGSCQEQQWVKARPPCSAVGASLKLARAPGPLGLSVLLPALLLSHGCRGTLKIGQHGQPGYY